jgi:outer membrane protein TolC
MLRYSSLSLAIVSALTLAGCANFAPKPYSHDQVSERIVQDRASMYADQEPVTAPIGFHQAVARALKYNLDYRLKLMESALAKNLVDVTQQEMLPKLIAGAGYSSRNNDSGGTSIGIQSGQETLSPSTSEQRYHRLADLDLTWSTLDFLVAYERSQQKADEVLMAEERRRKVMQNVVQDVRGAYWRALGAQKMIKQVNTLLDQVDGAIKTTRIAEERGLIPRQDSLAYQRALLDAMSIMATRRQDLELARAELAALMTLPPGTQFQLMDETEEALPTANFDIAKLELSALANRPEIMEEWYRKRVSENDIKIAKTELWPSLSVDLGTHYDSNAYLYNNDWNNAATRVSWNLLGLLKAPALNEAQDNQNKTSDLRRLSLSMAVLTQVRVAAQRYALASEQLRFADDSLRVDQSLLALAKANSQVSAGSELEFIRADARTLLSRYQRYAAYSDAQAAWGRLYNSIGLDVLPDTIASHDVQSLARELKKTMSSSATVNLSRANSKP